MRISVRASLSFPIPIRACGGRGATEVNARRQAERVGVRQAPHRLGDRIGEQILVVHVLGRSGGHPDAGERRDEVRTPQS
jgi:hypothetical protein